MGGLAHSGLSVLRGELDKSWRELHNNCEKTT